MAVTHFSGPISLDLQNGVAVTNAVTINAGQGGITSSTDNLAADTSETITLTNSLIKSADAIVLAQIVDPGLDGDLVVMSTTTAVGSVAIVVRNVNATTAMTSVYKVFFMIVSEG